MEHYNLNSQLYQLILNHGENVSRYCEILFRQLEDLHKLADDWLDLLLLAAKYHDIGSMQGTKAHHKKSYAKIMEDYSLPIKDDDRELVALIARYHRKSLPSLEHAEFTKITSLEQDGLCKVASLIRIADALDYGHQGIVTDIKAKISPNTIVITCHSPYNLTTETQRVIKKSDLFIRTFKREIKCKQA